MWSDRIVGDGVGDNALYKVLGKLTDLGLSQEDIDDTWKSLNSAYINEYGSLNLEPGQTWETHIHLLEGNPLNAAQGRHSFTIHHLP